MSGVLKGYDQLLNLVLDETVEYLRGECSGLLNEHCCQNSIQVIALLQQASAACCSGATVSGFVDSLGEPLKVLLPFAACPPQTHQTQCA